MAKRFYYMVQGGYEFFDGQCFGQAWKDAKAKASELHVAVFRRVEQDGKDDRFEVYLKGGCFLPVGMVGENRHHIF